MTGNAAPPTSLGRSIANTLKGSTGNLVEWYDVYVYSVFAIYFESQFFAKDDPSAQIYVWAIFAVTFVMRPIGSWYFGRYADRHGRRKALTFSVSLMAVCSLVIALTPTASMIGAWSVAILAIARLVQGFATGGEYGASATYLSEASVPQHRGLLSSMHYVTLVGGHVLAQLTLLIMVGTLSHDQIAAWGWRVAFALGGVGAIVAFILRRTMDETLSEDSLDREDTTQGSLRSLFTHHWRATLLCFFVAAAGPVLFYTYSVTGPAIVKATFSGGDVMAATTINLLALILLVALQPLGGWLSDRVGRRPLLIFFGIGGIAYTWFLVTVLPQQTDVWAAFAILAVGFVILTGFTSVAAVVKAGLFPTRIRALGVGLGYALANSLFGGTAPLLYTAAKADGAIPQFIVYVTIVVLASLIAYVFFLPKGDLNWLDDEEQMRALDDERVRPQDEAHLATAGAPRP